MKIGFWLFASLFTCVAAHAQETQAVRLTKSDLEMLLPNAKVTHVSSSGSNRWWTNNPDGTLFMSSDNKRFGSAGNTRLTSHEGNWRISEDGKFCVRVDWNRVLEDWCAAILKDEEGNYYLGKVGPASRIAFQK